jgi:hypothetical protein
MEDDVNAHYCVDLDSNVDIEWDSDHEEEDEVVEGNEVDNEEDQKKDEKEDEDDADGKEPRTIGQREIVKSIG